ncbi:hypothetical protein [Aestuariivivens insulae]|uniref:hypothetical protein n=1 Tax=Aestuariivivens insulae TaxID=1621988 RepID=UPI001F57FFB6|nr:hypothetical protein [Aestuariivivens insulae]
MNSFRLVIILTLINCLSLQAQLLEKLKERAKEKGLQVKEVSYDSTAVNRGFEEEEIPEIKSPRDFYNNDVVMALYNNDILVQTAFFDAETIAMRTEQVSNPKPIYHDDQGKFYAYNKDKGQYETIKLLPASNMGFMTAGITTQAYKLPPEPYFNAYKTLEELGSGLNFLILELAFIYKPSHFTNNDYYIQETVTCINSSTCTRFNYNDPEYPDSYIQFDNQGRLNELYINSTNPKLKDEPKGKFVFSYRPCTVKIPDAVEQSMIPGPLGKIINLEKGLEPWKHNKKDEQKN